MHELWLTIVNGTDLKTSDTGKANPVEPLKDFTRFKIVTKTELRQRADG